MKSQILKINQVIWDKSVYPRSTYNQFVANNYAKSLRAGATFPPIVVALYKRKYILVDGKHRLEAHKKVKIGHISTEIIKGLNKDQIYVESIKRNISHGLQISSFEKTKIILKLKDMNYDLNEIEAIISIPAKVIDNFVAKRITNTLTGEPVALKAGLRHLRGETINESAEEFYADQNILGMKQTYLLDQVIRLLELDYMDMKSIGVWQRLSMIQSMLKEKMPKVSPKKKETKKRKSRRKKK